MRITRRRGWEIPESRVTPEHLVTADRRGAGIGRRGILATTGMAAMATALPRRPAKADQTYDPGRPITDEHDATTYNNFYEFSDDKDLWQAAQALKPRPWTISIEGMVNQKQTIGIDDLLKQVTLEERVYRHRCVETWAMTVPWKGFPLSALLKIANPLASAKFVVFETAQDPSMPGIKTPFYPWPYIEGLTMAEAGNDLAFMVTGMYGKDLPPQNGTPLRLATPWKYGFKSAKSIVRITFTDRRPQTFWEQIAASEYGFWANVNPAVPHPRWSQAYEKLLGSNERVPTQIYNGYGAFVASLYTDLQHEKLYM